MKCLGNHCNWRLHVSICIDKKSCMVKKINGGTPSLALQLMDLIHVNPKIEIIFLEAKCKRKWGIVVLELTLYMARKITSK